MAQPPSVPSGTSEMRDYVETRDMLSDLKYLVDIPRTTKINGNTKRNPTYKKDPDLTDYIIVSSSLSIPKEKKKIEGGYEIATRRRIESSARKAFESSDDAGKLALYRQGHLGIISEV